MVHVYTKSINFAVNNYITKDMKPITNILLVIALACYVFLPIIEISHIGGISGMDFTSSLITYNSTQYTLFALTPFITLFLAIGFNCLRSRWWGILDAILILFAIFFFVNLLTKFQGLPLSHNPEVAADTEMSEGLPIIGLGIGFYLSSILTFLALLSALVSLMPFKFNKSIEHTFDKHFESGKKQISKVGHGIHDEIHKIGKHNKKDAPKQLSQEVQEPQETQEPLAGDDSRFKPEEINEDEKYKDYMPK